MSEQKHPLFNGLKIIEFGRFVAGPYAAELFAHGGADVIKIEPTDGDATRFNQPIFPGEGRQYIIKARGKRGFPVNLGDPKGLEIIQKITSDCDILISNMRPGSLQRYKLDYETLSKTNPRIIVGEISAFGKNGPYGGLAGADFQAQAASGLLLSAGAFDGEEPRYVDAFLTDYMAGTLLAFGISSALYSREVTGKGQDVSTTLYQAGLALQHGTANIFEAVDSWKHEFVDWVDSEKPSAREGANRRRKLGGGTAIAGLYLTADDRWLAIGSGRAGMTKLLPMLGLDDPLISDPTWVTPDDPTEYFAKLRAKIKVEIAKLASSELVPRLKASGIPYAIVEYLEEAMQGEQANDNGFVYSADHPLVGPMTMPEAPVSFGKDSYKADTKSPGFGEHTQEIMKELGYSAAEIDDLIKTGVISEILDDSARGS
ncbi:MAG: CoA transferase [Dehalococcoidia bacterium]|nr:CoA transferase [Dehalococcoidia bacterium]